MLKMAVMVRQILQPCACAATDSLKGPRCSLRTSNYLPQRLSLSAPLSPETVAKSMLDNFGLYGEPVVTPH